MKKVLLLLIGLFLCGNVYAYNCKIEPTDDWNTPAERENYIEYTIQCKLKKADNYSEKVDSLLSLEHILTFNDNSEYTIDVVKTKQFVTLELIYNQIGYMATNESAKDSLYDYYETNAQDYYSNLWKRYQVIEDIPAVKQLAFSTRLIKLAYTLELKGYLDDYKMLDILETNLLSFLKYTTNQASFKSVYTVATSMADKHYNAKCVNIPGQVASIAMSLARKKGFQL